MAIALFKMGERTLGDRGWSAFRETPENERFGPVLRPKRFQPLSLPTSLINPLHPHPPPFSAHGGVVGMDDFAFAFIYSEGVPSHSPGLPRFAATPGRRKTNAVPQGGSVRFRCLRISIPDKSFALCDRIAFQQCGSARRSEIVGSRSLLLTVPLQGTELFLSQPGVAAKRGNPGL